MAFFDKVGETISSKSKDVAKKAKEMAEIVSLNSKISTQEEIIKRAYIEIGKAFYEKFKTDLSNEFGVEFEKITAANDEIARIKTEIQAIKNSKLCSKCGAQMTADAIYCSKCGYKSEVEAVEPEAVEPEVSQTQVTEAEEEKETDNSI